MRPPQRGIPQVAAVAAALHTRHINVNQLSDTWTTHCLASAVCLVTHLVAQSAATHGHTSASQLCLPTSYLITCEWPQSELCIFGGARGRRVHIAHLYGSVFDAGEAEGRMRY
jgi:hypothetical protein